MEVKDFHNTYCEMADISLDGNRLVMIIETGSSSSLNLKEECETNGQRCVVVCSSNPTGTDSFDSVRWLKLDTAAMDPLSILLGK